MRNANVDLISPFYSHLCNDLYSRFPRIFPKFVFDDAIAEASTAPTEFVLSLTRLGKSIDKALINRDSRVEVPTHGDSSGQYHVTDGLDVALGILFNEKGFFRGHTEAVFGLADREQLALSDADDKLPSLIQCVRQWCLAFSKVEDIDPAVDEVAILENFKRRITSVRDVNLEPAIATAARRFLKDIFYDGESLHPALAQWEAIPFGRHGPGAVADGSEGADKWMFSCIPGIDGLIYRYLPDCSPDTERYLDSLDNNSEEGVSRVCLVPKDLLSRRMICIEPKELQFAQQGLMKIVYDLVQRHPLAKRLINFHDQEPSREMAKNVGLATIDLSDASDLLTKRLARLLLPRDVYRLLTRYRARGISMPDGTVVQKYETFMTMGNALCFPMESLIFLAICVGTRSYWDSAVQKHLARWYRGTANPGHLAQHLCCRVFGDDIILPVYLAEEVMHALMSAGLSVNRLKTCYATPVRESCGAWFYAGQDASITRLKHSRLDNMYSWVSVSESCKEILRKGFPQAAEILASHLSALHPIPYGYNGYPDSSGYSTIAQKMGVAPLLRTSDGHFAVRRNIQLQRIEWLVPILRKKIGSVPLPGNAGLYAYFTRQATLPAIYGEATSLDYIWSELLPNDL